MNRKMVITALALIASAIVFGAFGAHALKEIVPTDKVASFETGVRYQLFQGLGILILGLHSRSFQFSLKWVFGVLLAGTVLFSASIYLLVLGSAFETSLSILGPITPIGGLLMISGWILLMVRVISDRQISA